MVRSTSNSRIAHPAKTSQPQIFSWLICESYDDKGNVIVYEYAEENDANVDDRFANEQHREVTAGRYLKSVRYGNRTSRLIQPDLSLMEWLFELVFDYDEGHYEELPPVVGMPSNEQRLRALAAPKLPDTKRWRVRPDPFSVFRCRFETRTYRRCRRVLMFHSFKELSAEPCLVRATEFEYGDFDYTDFNPASPHARKAERHHVGSTRAGSFIQSVKQTAFARDPGAAVVQKNGVSYFTYFRKSVPPVEFEYTRVTVSDAVHEIDLRSLEHLPVGVDGSAYQFVDLDGDGLSGILTQQAEAWHYKRPLGEGRFAPATVVPSPSTSVIAGDQLLDLAGDGQLDVVAFAGAAPGFFERTKEGGWASFRTFRSLPNIDWNDPHLQFIDLNGDGHADVLITEPETLVWYPSLGEDGFGHALRTPRALDEERGPQRLFADRRTGYFVADMSGDGLSDLVRVSNGEVAYWPNLGYGEFGPKITMDEAPWFEDPAHFDARRVRLADIDGTGATDLIYLAKDGVRLFANQAGNRWGGEHRLSSFPQIDELASISTADLLGNGTACLVWSSALPANSRRSMRYVDLMGGQKPHLLVRVTNNLGTETVIRYAPSTKFYLADEREGCPWVTRLPFPVHVVERVETHDYVSRTRFVTRYAYHHGYFDGVEREFRGFGMVEQWDSESFEALAEMGEDAENIDAASHVPPVHTKAWFHTGAYLDGAELARYFAGTVNENDRGEYYREPTDRFADGAATSKLLPDHLLPAGLSGEEERQACRALRGAMLRQEVYGRKGSSLAEHPYAVTQSRYAVVRLQEQLGNRHAVFTTHPLETLSYDYERNPADPRTAHTLTLEVDRFGNVIKKVAIAYPRRHSDGTLPLDFDRERQSGPLLTYTESDLTAPLLDEDDAYRTPLPAETRTYELTGYTATGVGDRFRAEDFISAETGALIVQRTLEFEEEATGGKERRLIEVVRTLYRKNDLTGLSPLRTAESLALSGESYQLALTRGLIEAVFRRPLDRIVSAGSPLPASLLPSLASVLGSRSADGGGYVELDGDGRWWVPTGRTFYSPNAGDTAATERDLARAHFFVPRRYESPFGAKTTVEYDPHDLLLRETIDGVGNRVTVGGRKADGSVDPTVPGNDYRVLQARAVTTPNRNRAIVVFDVLGLVAGTAVQGKDETVGDNLAGFEPDLTPAQIGEFFDSANPRASAASLLKNASTRVISDIDRFWVSRKTHPSDRSRWQPACSATVARETHVNAALPPHGQRIQVLIAYSDGFGRVIQSKAPAEPGPVVEGGPVVDPRWVATGWTIFNNKGAPVRQYEPFFSRIDKGHRFEFGQQVGVSSVLFYDAVGRAVVTLNPDGTYEKVVHDAWTIRAFDVNDTVAAHGDETGDPRTDPDVREYVAKYFESRPTWRTWLARRAGNALGAREQKAADAASKHADTPSTQYLDVLGRTFLTLSHVVRADGTRASLASRVKLDIEGNRVEIRDAVIQNDDKRGRLIVRHHFDMLGNAIHQASMESGERWTLADSVGKPIRTWDSLGRAFRTEYDAVRRPLKAFVGNVLTERMVYGEQHPQNEQLNLRGTLWLHLDSAGAVTSDERDFKGNLLRSSRRLAKEYKITVDWTGVEDACIVDDDGHVNPATIDIALTPVVETDRFVARTAYDAQDRPVQLIPPHRAGAGTCSAIQPVFNEANLLERVDVWLALNGLPSAWLDPGTTAPSPVGIQNVDYDAKGRRVVIEYKNGSSTRYKYDPETFRLRRLYTRRGATFSQDCTNPAPPPVTIAAPETPPPDVPSGLQQLHYTYDPAGNITNIRDAAQDVLFFQGQVIKAEADYVYDSLYRLISATGRERLQNVAGPPIPHSHSDASRTGIPWTQNLSDLMGMYVEEYVYDDAGNLASLAHRRSTPAHPGWTRNFARDEPSEIEEDKTNNRLTHAVLGADGAAPERFLHDALGNIIRAAHLAPGANAAAPNLHWNDGNQLTRADLGGGGTAWYVYDGSGQRIRKVWEKSAALIEERIYLGGFEIFRRRDGAGNVALERETLHIMDDHQRIALVETRTIGNDPAPKRLIRYQVGNHLGSAILELDDNAQIISYEEYSPYGSTTYQAVRGDIETPKRYRYTGKERDEESGFYYHGARYYAPWLARWTSADPAGLVDGLNLYRYCSANPIGLSDPTGLFGWKDIKQGAAAAVNVANTAVDKARALNPQVKQLNEDLGRVNRALELLNPGGAAIKGVATGLADNASQAITGKSSSPTPRPDEKLSVEKRIEAANDAIMTFTPLAPIHHLSKAVSKAVVGVVTGQKMKTEAALDVAKAEPTGLVGKASETEEGLEKASAAQKQGKTGDAIRSYIDAGTSFVEFMNIGVSLGIGGVKGPKGSGGGPKGPATPVPEPATPQAPKAPALESAGKSPQHYTQDLSNVTGKGGAARTQALQAIIEEDFGNLKLTHEPQYSPHIRTGVAQEGAGTQIGKNSFSSRQLLRDVIVHEELHHRWWKRGIQDHHPMGSVKETQFYRTIDRYMRLRGWK